MFEWSDHIYIITIEYLTIFPCPFKKLELTEELTSDLNPDGNAKAMLDSTQTAETDPKTGSSSVKYQIAKRRANHLSLNNLIPSSERNSHLICSRCNLRHSLFYSPYFVSSSSIRPHQHFYYNNPTYHHAISSYLYQHSNAYRSDQLALKSFSNGNFVVNNKRLNGEFRQPSIKHSIFKSPTSQTSQSTLLQKRFGATNLCYMQQGFGGHGKLPLLHLE
jgi:hypothetical protein